MIHRARGLVSGVVGGRSGPLLLALGGCLLILAVFAPRYFTLDNIRVLGLNVAPTAIASVGMAFLVIGGKVDLSVGSIFAWTAYIAAWLSVGLPSWLAIGAGIAAGGLIGWLNGLLVWRIRVSPIIVTLGSLACLRGLLLVVSNGRGVGGVPEDFTVLGRALVGGAPLQLWILVVLIALADVALLRTTLGRHVYALGGSAEASEVAGVNVRRMTLGLFALNGAFVALAGVITASRFGTATSQFGIGFELDVLTAVILGGVAFTGGEGSISVVIVAVIFLGVVNSGMISLGVSAYYVDVIKGGALIASVGIEQLTQERRDRYRKNLAIAEFAQEVAERRDRERV